MLLPGTCSGRSGSVLRVTTHKELGASLSNSVLKVAVVIQTIQSKIVAHLVPPTCTDGCECGTTQLSAKKMHIWVWLTHPIFYAQLRIMVQADHGKLV
jgi:hypothetical protein